MTGYFPVVVVAAYVFDTLSLESWDAFGMQHELLEFVIDTFIGRLHVDDGAQLVFIDNLVILRFTATDTDDAFRHSQQ